MKRKTDVYLNSVSLSDVHKKILAVYAVEHEPEENVSYASAARLSGRYVIFEKRENLNISVFFKVREIYDMAERMEVIDAVNTWAARGGDLKLSYRPGRTLPVKLIKAASPANIREYNNEIEILFTSEGFAFWQDDAQTQTQTQGANVFLRLPVSGNAPSTVDVTMRFTKATTFARVTIADTRISLSNLSMEEGDVVTIAHDANGIASILHAGESIFDCLTDDSNDRLLSPGGVTEAAFESDGEAEITFTTRGRWM